MFELQQLLQGVESSSPLIIAGTLFLFTFVSEDIACVAAGALAAHGSIGLSTAIVACFAGIVLGDAGLYWAGRAFGRKLIYSPLAARVVSPAALDKASAWLNRGGASIVFFSRFVSGLRLPTYLAAGMFRTDFIRYFFFFILAAAIWTPVAIGVAYFTSGLLAYWVFPGMIAAFVIVRTITKLASWEGRRLAYGKLRRLIEWEFWPVQIFYFPVVLYIIVLAIRFKSLTAFTLANPAIVSGGLIGESKHAIYEMIKASQDAGEYLLRHELIPRELTYDEKIRRVRQFMARHAIDLPIVLKPDVGERGKGVTIARRQTDLEEYLATAKRDAIVQEFFDGVEASVFYYRFPGELSGQIFSITEKKFPSVNGDGSSDLRTLILRDPRAVAMAQSYFKHNAGLLDRIPANGAVVSLVDIGTHSRGAVFADGEWLRTEKLAATIDRFSRNVSGFYFGRFDLRAKNFTDFQNGGPFKIIELNGVASESTSIYDSRYSLFDAYKTLFTQWRIAFEIGTANRRRGKESMKVGGLLTLVWRNVFTP